MEFTVPKTNVKGVILHCATVAKQDHANHTTAYAIPSAGKVLVRHIRHRGCADNGRMCDSVELLKLLSLTHIRQERLIATCHPPTVKLVESWRSKEDTELPVLTDQNDRRACSRVASLAGLGLYDHVAFISPLGDEGLASYAEKLALLCLISSLNGHTTAVRRTIRRRARNFFAA